MPGQHWEDRAEAPGSRAGDWLIGIAALVFLTLQAVFLTCS